MVGRDLKGQRIFVTGEVNAPGPMELDGPMSALEAVMFAGGFDTYTAEPDPGQLEERAVKAFLESLRVDVSSESNIITVGYQAYSPRMSRRVLATVLDLFLDKHIQVHRSSESLSFFQEQKATLEAMLEEDENRLNQLKKRAGTGSLADEQTIVMNRINQLTREIETTENNLASAEAKILTFEAALRDMPRRILSSKTTGMRNVTAERLTEQLMDLKLQEQKLLARYREDALPVQSVREEIARAEEMLAGQERPRTENTESVNDVHQRILSSLLMEDADRKARSAMLVSLKEQRKEARGELERLIDLENDISRLERQLKLHQENYFKYADKTEQARINRALETERISNISIVQSPIQPIKPTKPRRALNIVLGFFLALFGSLGFAFAAEYLDQTFKRPEGVEETLQVPVFASVPETGKSMPVGAEATKRTLDHFKTLRDGICFSGMCNGGGNSLVVTGCHKGEGATSTALNLGRVLAAGEDQKALVVDANRATPACIRPWASTSRRDSWTCCWAPTAIPAAASAKPASPACTSSRPGPCGRR